MRHGVKLCVAPSVYYQVGNNHSAPRRLTHCAYGLSVYTYYIAARPEQQFASHAQTGHRQKHNVAQAVLTGVCGVAYLVFCVMRQTHQRIVGGEPQPPSPVFLNGKHAVKPQMEPVAAVDEAVGGAVKAKQAAAVGYCPHVAVRVFHALYGVADREVAVLWVKIPALSLLRSHQVSAKAHDTLVFRGHPHVAAAVFADAAHVYIGVKRAAFALW